MKSNRMRFGRPVGSVSKDPASPWLLAPTRVNAPVELAQMPAPIPVARLHPDQIIEDILVSTLCRVQASSHPALAAAAARYVTLLRERAL